MKRILALILSVVLMLGIAVPAYAIGDENIDSGGGNLGNGTSTSYWNPGMDGVRVTIVEADSHSIASTSVDLTNKTPSANIIDFGKVCKLSYNGGRSLSPKVNSYSYRNPAQSLRIRRAMPGPPTPARHAADAPLPLRARSPIPRKIRSLSVRRKARLQPSCHRSKPRSRPASGAPMRSRPRST